MKVHRTGKPDDVFDAVITTDHPETTPGPIALKRLDTSEFISLGDCFGIPGHPLSHQKYEIIDLSDEEIKRLDEGGIRVVAL